MGLKEIKFKLFELCINGMKRTRSVFLKQSCTSAKFFFPNATDCCIVASRIQQPGKVWSLQLELPQKVNTKIHPLLLTTKEQRGRRSNVMLQKQASKFISYLPLSYFYLNSFLMVKSHVLKSQIHRTSFSLFFFFMFFKTF